MVSAAFLDPLHTEDTGDNEKARHNGRASLSNHCPIDWRGGRACLDSPVSETLRSRSGPSARVEVVCPCRSLPIAAQLLSGTNLKSILPAAVLRILSSLEFGAPSADPHGGVSDRRGRISTSPH